MDTGIADATPLEIQLGIRAANALRQSRDGIDIAVQKVRETAGELAHSTAEAAGRMVQTQRPDEIDPLTRGRIEAARDAERHARERAEKAEKREDRGGRQRGERSR